MRFRALRVSVCAAVLLFAGCARQEAVAPLVPEQRQGGRLIRRIENDVNTLNYLLHTTDQERFVLSYLHDPMIDLDASLRPIPGTIEKWEVGDGGKTYTLHVDPRATFSDGTPVTAADVLFTVQKIVGEEAPQFASTFDSFDPAQSRVVDDRTVVIAFHEPRAAQLLAFNVAVLPEHVYGKGNFKNDYNDTVIGDGPYKLATHVRGQSILLESRQNYWRDKPRIDSILFRVLGDDAVAWQALQRDDIDEMRVKTDVWANSKDRVAGMVNFYDLYLLQYNCIPWNLRDPLFKDVRARKALAMLVDQQGMIAGLYRGHARQITGPFTPDQWAYDSSVKPLSYDVAGAKRLLAEVGWSDSNGDGILDRGGKKFAFDILIPAGSRVAAEQTQVLQQAFRAGGVQMDIRTLDGAMFFDRLMKRDFQAALMAWTIDPDPDPYGLFHSKQIPPAGLNIVSYANPQVDALIDAARKETNFDKRRDLYHQIHRQLAEDQPYLWTVQVGTKWAVNKRVRAVEVSKGFGLFNWYPGPRAWWLAGK